MKVCLGWPNTLRSVIQGPENDLRVRDVVSDRGWEWSKITMELPLPYKLEIEAIPCAASIPKPDKLAWASNPQGVFDLKSAYDLAIGSKITPSEGESIWKLKTLPKIQYFIWKCLHNSIGVKTCLASQDINSDLLCQLCKHESETIIHILRDCEVIKQVLWNFGVQRNDIAFFGGNLLSWFVANTKFKSGATRGQTHWSSIFLFDEWCIWLKRNAIVFRNNPFPVDLHVKILQRAKEFAYCAVNYQAPTRVVLKPIRWEKPPRGWIKLNTDGSSLGNPGLAGGGGIFQNEEGKCVLGFSRHIGITTSSIAELQAARDGSSCPSYNSTIWIMILITLESGSFSRVVLSMPCCVPESTGLSNALGKTSSSVVNNGGSTLIFEVDILWEKVLATLSLIM